MYYIIENAYTKKLYAQLKENASTLKMLAIADVITLEPGLDCIVDEDDFDAFNALNYMAGEVVVLTDIKPELSQNNITRYVKKYQSASNIFTLVTRATFPITFLTFASKSPNKDAFVESVIKKYDIDTVISLDFNPNSSFSLFDSLTRDVYKLYNQGILDVITNIQDYLHPPTSDLIVFINRQKEKGRLLILSSPLKGALDAAIIAMSDTIVLVENDNTLKLEPHLTLQLKTKRIEVITDDGLS